MNKQTAKAAPKKAGSTGKGRNITPKTQHDLPASYYSSIKQAKGKGKRSDKDVPDL